MTKDKTTPATELSDEDLAKASGGNFEEIKVTFKKTGTGKTGGADGKPTLSGISGTDLGSGR